MANNDGKYIICEQRPNKEFVECWANEPEEYAHMYEPIGRSGGKFIRANFKSAEIARLEPDGVSDVHLDNAHCYEVCNIFDCSLTCGADKSEILENVSHLKSLDMDAKFLF